MINQVTTWQGTLEGIGQSELTSTTNVVADDYYESDSLAEPAVDAEDVEPSSLADVMEYSPPVNSVEVKPLAKGGFSYRGSIFCRKLS